MHDHDRLKQILDDPASTPEEKTAAQAALDGQAAHESVAVHDDTRMMLAALKVERVADLTEEIYGRYCVARSVESTHPIVLEFRYWIPPDERMLWLLQGGDRVANLRWWWKNILNICGERPDVKAHARRQLAALA